MAGLAVLPLLPTLGGGFVADDFMFVTVLERVTRPFGDYLVGAVLAMREVPTTFYRPLPMATLLLELRAFASDPWPIHLVNLALHALAAIGVWGLARRLVQGPGASGAAIVAALAWAWFPRRVEAVAWISCRPDLLASVLGLAGVWLWVEGDRARRAGCRAAGVLVWATALLSKESALLLPLALAAWPSRDGQPAATTPRAFLREVAARVATLWPFAAGGAAYFVLRRAATGAFVGGYAGQPLAFGADTAIKHLAYPAIPPIEVLNRWLLDPRAFLLATALVGLGTLGLWAAIAATRRHAAVAFGAAWWLVAALPVLTLQPSLTTTFNDRLLYLSGMGFAWIVAGWWAAGGRRLRAAVALALALVTAQTVALAWRWPVAGDLTARLVRDIAAASREVDTSLPLLVVAAPDSYGGAYALRNGLDYALQREGIAHPARALVVSHYLMESAGRMPVEVTVEAPDTVWVRGRDGRAEVMIAGAERPSVVTRAGSATNDRYGRHADVRLTLHAPALVLVAAPDGVRSLGRLGVAAGADPSAAPRVGPRQ